MTVVITDLVGNASNTSKPTIAEAEAELEDMLARYISEGYVVRSNKGVHSVTTATGQVVHQFTIKPQFGG